MVALAGWRSLRNSSANQTAMCFPYLPASPMTELSSAGIGVGVMGWFHFETIEGGYTSGFAFSCSPLEANNSEMADVTNGSSWSP